MISSELKGYFDKVEREGGFLLDSLELFSGEDTVDLIIKQRVEKADIVSAIGWITNDRHFFYYMKHEDGGLDYYYQNAQGGRLFAYSTLFDHGLASKSDQRFASIRSTGNLTFSTAF
ncbi:hypothetical protein E5O99_22005 [Escherichia coli]|nr:hypothetical protein E5O99_22005 [Escherichia coli]